ncbi:MAG: glycoside hydrolase [Capsulimonadaceae bacterium]
MSRTGLYIVAIAIALAAKPGDAIPNGGVDRQIALTQCAGASAGNLIVDAGLDQPGQSGIPAGWGPIWDRDSGAASVDVDAQAARGGPALRVVSTGQRDWSLAQADNVVVHDGEILRLAAKIKCQSVQYTQVNVVERDAAGRVIDWNGAGISVSGTHDWQTLSRSFVVPPGCCSIQFRLIGAGTGTSWMAEPVLVRVGDLDAIVARWKGRTYVMRSPVLTALFDPSTASFTVTDRRTGTVWRQFSAERGAVTVAVEVPHAGSEQTHNQADSEEIRYTVQDITSGLILHVRAVLPRDQPQMRLTLSAEGTLVDSGAAYPLSFLTEPGQSLVVPMNEGILYPVDDAGVEPHPFPAFQGHGGLSMPWLGQVDARGAGLITLLRTPDDARIDVVRTNGLLYAAPVWLPSHGRWSYSRKLSYVFLDRGGYVAQALWYRRYAQQSGLLVTLKAKTALNPNVELLLGAADIWTWQRDKLAICKEMKSVGLDRVLWSSGGSPDEVAAINALGYLTGKYDNYQDGYQADAPNGLLKVRWPQDVMLDPGGQPLNGWLTIRTEPDGTTKSWQSGVVSSGVALSLAEESIPADLKSTPYGARFVDTTTASPWREDYNPAHPLTRSQDRANRLALLDLCSRHLKLVTGSETGLDAAVPCVDYFEGMMSLANYRYPNAGRNMQRIVDPTPDILKYQVGPFYRIPLWELVYHDCTVSYWYWGDYNNKMPSVWRRRDLFNILYATPPIYMFDRALWNAQRDRFVDSYRQTSYVARQFATDEMLTHEFLTPDHTLQRTRWSSGSSIVVNFSDQPQRTPEGVSVNAMDWKILRTTMGRPAGPGTGSSLGRGKNST